MLLRNIKLLVLVGFVVLVLSAQTNGQNRSWQMIHGDVIQVDSKQQKLLLKSEGNGHIFVLEDDCAILRHGQETTLEALRPISTGAYQDALCWINPQGKVSYILVNYSVEEIDGALVNYDIFGNRK